MTQREVDLTDHPVRILQVVGKMDRAGAETLLMNLYRQMDREKVQFDFLVHRPEPGDYEGEIVSLGGKIYRLPRMSPSNLVYYWREAQTFFRGNPEYRVVHSHIDAMSVLPLFAAKSAGVPLRIAHSHNTAFPKDIKYPLRQAAKRLLPWAANCFFACSRSAGDFLFPRDVPVMVLPNAIELERFCFSQTGREEKRRELGISTDALVIGHVGRLSRQKNHRFLLQVFASLRRKRPQAVLLLVGQGELLDEIKAQARTLDLEDAIRFLGVREDIPALLWAMDLFLLPSLYEGFPVVGVEAQAAGLPCLVSDTVRPDLKLTEAVEFLPLSVPPERWVQRALDLAGMARGSGDGLARQGFDIREQAARMQEFYLSCCEEEKACKKY